MVVADALISIDIITFSGSSSVLFTGGIRVANGGITNTSINSMAS